MNRTLLPLLPLSLLAAVVAFSACSRPKEGEAATHVIPPAILAPPPVAMAPAPPPAAEEPPSAEEIAAFERPVAK